MVEKRKAGRPKKDPQDLGLDRSINLPSRVWEVIAERVKRGEYTSRNALIREAVEKFLTGK